MEAKKPLVIPVIIVAGLILYSPSDSVISIEDTVAANNEATTSTSKTSNSSAGATTTITMIGILSE